MDVNKISLLYQMQMCAYELAQFVGKEQVFGTKHFRGQSCLSWFCLHAGRRSVQKAKDGYSG